MTAPRLDLAELRRLHEAATPGPWGISDPKVETHHGWKPDGEFRPGYNAVEVTCEEGAAVVCAAETDKSCTPHKSDAALIAAMRNALPALLSIADAAEALDNQRLANSLGTPESSYLMEIKLGLALRAALAAVRKEEKGE